MADVSKWTGAQEDVTIGKSYEPQTTGSQCNWSVISGQKRWNLIGVGDLIWVGKLRWTRKLIWTRKLGWSWELIHTRALVLIRQLIWILIVGENRSWLCNVDVAWHKERRILSWNCRWRSGNRAEFSWVGVIVLVLLMNGILFHNPAVLRDVRGFIVVWSAVVHIAEAVVEKRWRSSWWRRNVRVYSVVDPIQVIENALISDVVKAENICPFVGSRHRFEEISRWWLMVRIMMKVGRWRRPNEPIVIVKQSSFTLHTLLERLACRFRLHYRYKKQTVRDLEEKRKVAQRFTFNVN